MIKDKKIDGIADVNDESDRHGMRIVIDLKSDANSNVVLNKLYKMTQMQSAFSVNNVALVNGVPKVMNLKDIIEAFVDHRHEVVIRRSRFLLAKAQERAHIVEGLIVACDNIDEVIRIIRSSKTTEEARTRLGERFNLDELQTRAIVEMRLSALTGLNIEKLHAEYEELERQIEFLNSVLTDDAVCRKVIEEELSETRDK